MSVWYCPELNEMNLARAHEGFLFRDEGGPFQLWYGTPWTDMKVHKFYWVGDFD
jgi:hypothetical protein